MKASSKGQWKNYSIDRDKSFNINNYLKYENTLKFSSLETPDIVQEYTQTNENMKRIVYLRPNPILAFDKDILLRIERGFYVHPEAGLQWFKTYHQHQSNILRLKPTFHDQCLMFTSGMICKWRPVITCATCLKTHDIFHMGAKELKNMKDNTVTKFKYKSTDIINQGWSATFNGTLLKNNSSTIKMCQPLDKPNITLIDPDSFTTSA